MSEEQLHGVKFAHFDEDSATFNTISENNSILYKLDVRGSNSDSTKQTRIRFNDVEIVGNVGYKTGLNLKVLTETGKIVEEKVFSGVGSYSAMKEYLTSLKGDYIIPIVSHGELTYDEESENVLFHMGSSAFPNKLMLKQIKKISYAAIYSNKMKKIVCEGFLPTQGNGVDSSIQIEKVYDSINDVGVTGTPQKYIEDYQEYQSSSADDYEMIQYPHNEISSPLSKHNLKSGDTILISLELFRNEEAKNANVTARFFNNYFTDDVYSEGIRINAQGYDKWEKIERIYTIPKNVDSVVTGCIRYPSDNPKGIVGVRNIVITHVSGEVKQTGNTSFGINGIRATEVKDNGNFSNPVMQLLILPKDNKHIVSNNLKEFPID